MIAGNNSYLIMNNNEVFLKIEILGINCGTINYSNRKRVITCVKCKQYQEVIRWTCSRKQQKR